MEDKMSFRHQKIIDPASVWIARVFLPILLLIYIPTACSSPLSSPAPTQTPEIIVTEALETDTPPAEPTSTAAPILSEPTATAISPTLINKPVLLLEEAQAFVEELLDMNGGCELPCWWGITPGVTTWEEAYRFFAPFAIEISDPVEEFYVERGEEQKTEHYNVVFPRKGDNSRFTLGIAVKNGIVEIIAQSNVGTERYFSPYLLIDRYEVPKEILIAIEPRTPAGKPYYSMVLLFERGIGVHYAGEAELINHQIEICPEKVRPRLSLFSESHSIERMKRILNVDHVKSLYFIPGFDKDTFLSQLSAQSSCFLTELKIWEEP
jgi:hypothetical protein